MKTTTQNLTKIIIEDVPRLDPIHVYLEDLRPGAGSLLVRCFDRAWYAYWGAMGSKHGTPTTVREFVMACDPGYITDNLVRGNRVRITSNQQQEYESAYVNKIVTAIRQAIQAQQPRLTPYRIARLERLEHANALVKTISDYGRRFFWNENHKRVARLELDASGRIYWIDEYNGKRVFTGTIGGHKHRWVGFSNSGTLRDIVEQMVLYVQKGVKIRRWYIANYNWGYAPNDMQATRDEAFKLPIIDSN